MDLLQGQPRGNKLLSLAVIEVNAQGGGTAAAAIVGGAPPKAQENLPAAMLHRVGNELPHPVCGGPGGISPLAHHGKPRGGGHFNNSARTLAAIDPLDGLSIGPGHGGLNPLGSNGLHKAIHRPLSPVCHRDRKDLAPGEEFGNGLSGHAADLQAGDGALEGVGNDNTLFHALTC